MGTVTTELYWKHAPNTCRNFAELARRGYLNGTKFYRIFTDFFFYYLCYYLSFFQYGHSNHGALLEACTQHMSKFCQTCTNGYTTGPNSTEFSQILFIIHLFLLEWAQWPLSFIGNMHPTHVGILLNSHEGVTTTGPNSTEFSQIVLFPPASAVEGIKSVPCVFVCQRSPGWTVWRLTQNLVEGLTLTISRMSLKVKVISQRSWSLGWKRDFPIFRWVDFAYRFTLPCYDC